MSAQPKTLPPLARLRYTRPLQLLHVIEVDGASSVEVFADPDMGSYEWLIRRADGSIERFSDVGYGQAATALRAGLNVYFA